jgi:hypothetical protein
MLERCEIVEAVHALDRTGYRCTGEACVHCSDCGNAVCAKHSEVCQICRTVFCTGCLDFHTHPKVVSVESKRDRRKIA